MHLRNASMHFPPSWTPLRFASIHFPRSSTLPREASTTAGRESTRGQRVRYISRNSGMSPLHSHRTAALFSYRSVRETTQILFKVVRNPRAVVHFVIPAKDVILVASIAV